MWSENETQTKLLMTASHYAPACHITVMKYFIYSIYMSKEYTTHKSLAHQTTPLNLNSMQISQAGSWGFRREITNKIKYKAAPGSHKSRLHTGEHKLMV